MKLSVAAFLLFFGIVMAVATVAPGDQWPEAIGSAIGISAFVSLLQSVVRDEIKKAQK